VEACLILGLIKLWTLGRMPQKRIGFKDILNIPLWIIVHITF
jgi:hypothetical protein